MKQDKATLRVCASCEWIFKYALDCPKCHFGSYGARHVYGDKCYTYLRTQFPWKEKLLTKYSDELEKQIKQANEKYLRCGKCNSNQIAPIVDNDETCELRRCYTCGFISKPRGLK